MYILNCRIAVCAILLGSASFVTLTSPAQSTATNNPTTRAVPQTAAKPVQTDKPGSVRPGAALPSKTTPQQPGDQSPQTLPPAPESADTSLLTAVPLKITLTPSENPIKLGSTSNIAADILNVSDRPVAVDTSTIQLMTHAILSQTDTLCVLPLPPTTNTTLMGAIILQP
jgi:hypothetical protein